MRNQSDEVNVRSFLTEGDAQETSDDNIDRIYKQEVLKMHSCQKRLCRRETNHIWNEFAKAFRNKSQIFVDKRIIEGMRSSKCTKCSSIIMKIQTIHAENTL